MVRARMLTLALLVMAVACSAETPEAEPVSPDDDVEASPDTDGEPAEDDAGEDAEEVSADAEEDAEEPSADTGEDASTEPGVTVGFNPRMVLYDGDGEPVEAVVTGSYAKFPQNAQPGDVWNPDNPDVQCASVTIEGPGGLPVALNPRLDTGDVSGCVLHGTTTVRYRSDDCSGDFYVPLANYGIVMADGAPMRPAGQVVEAQVSSYFANGDCVALSHPAFLLQLEPLPSWMVNAFPNPPYEVRLEF